MTSRRNRAMRNLALRIITLLFILALISRSGLSIGASVAQTKDLNPINFQSPEQQSAELDLREQKIKANEMLISAKLEAIEQAEINISEREKAIESQENELRRLYTLHEESAKADIKKLVSVYETMKPKDAGKLLSQMDPEFSAGFIAEMQTQAAADILANIEVDTAYNISSIIATRNNKGYIEKPSR